MAKLIKRAQSKLAEKLLASFPVVAVIGSRQVGKTTLVQKLLPDQRAYLSFDDPSNLSIAENNPMSFLTQQDQVTLDEVQKLPSVLTAVKRLVDEQRKPGQFILTGSANLSLLPKISESLAGRITFIEMFPLTIFECFSDISDPPRMIKLLSASKAEEGWKILKNFKKREIPLKKLLVKGGYPSAYLEEDDDLRFNWFKGYVRSYLERDVLDLSNIRNLHDFQKFLSLSAFRCGQILNKSDLARDAGIPFTTASHFLDLLLASFQIFLIEPFFRNIGKRLIKSPKLMWNDTGLAIHLQGLNSWVDVERLGRAGHLIENKMAIEIKSLLSVYLPWAKLYYWRTSGGAEIDLLVENKTQLIPIEIKWSEKIDHHDLASLEAFMKDFANDCPWGMVLYRGKELLKIKENIFLVPFEMVL